MKRFILVVLAIFTVLRVSGQDAANTLGGGSGADQHTTVMQNMIVRLIMEAATDFKKIKGAEISRKEGEPVAYQAMISYIAKDDEERGAMLTTDDKIIEVHGHTFYVATYTDDDPMFSLREFVGTVISSMPEWKGDARFTFTTHTEPVQNTSDLHSTALLLNGKRVAVFNEYLKAEKCALIIGLEQ